jgi:hypothetical protein
MDRLGLMDHDRIGINSMALSQLKTRDRHGKVKSYSQAKVYFESRFVKRVELNLLSGKLLIRLFRFLKLPSEVHA